MRLIEISICDKRRGADMTGRLEKKAEKTTFNIYEEIMRTTTEGLNYGMIYVKEDSSIG